MGRPSLMRKLSTASVSGSFSKGPGSLRRRTRGAAWNGHHTSRLEICDDGEADHDLTLKAGLASYLRSSTVARSRTTKRPRLQPSTFLGPSGEQPLSSDGGLTSSRPDHMISLHKVSPADGTESPTPAELLGLSPEGRRTDEARDGDGCNGSQPKEPSRWTKMVTLKSEGKGHHGFRGLFR
ncbi:hypothetical protein GMORB2_6893 [Geosmithia morbida]|uniref:Uncharacterized protein n=1 Tax=Geosmithia morbida TaxID=1094350 RepID=A0A9P4YVJ2_9HYPO|nr:uncharacterized protein GMORB2_6893 [Geosmithia morbida]KAF4122587.1 hypothetical protein GMORB2_6893 [Geosmithia morbida]